MQTVIGGEECLERAGEHIRSGEVVAFPTETVYGLGGDALNPASIDKIYEAKGRPRDNPLIVHVSCLEDVDKVAFLTPEAELLFRKFTPGPLTIVLKKRDCIPDCVSAGLDTVGVRIPKPLIARRFIKESGRPIAAPSANTSKRVSPTTAQFVYDDMTGKIPLIIDGGDCEVGIESTVLSLATDIPTILRPGAVTKEMLSEYLPSVKNFTGEILIAPAPGMKYKHYAPLSECLMFSDPSHAVSLCEKYKKEGKKVVVLCKTDVIPSVKGCDYVNLGADGEEVAHNIFRAMRECEKSYDCILLQELADYGVEASVMNRITKSCGGKNI